MNDFLVGYGLSRAYGETWVVVPQPQSSDIVAYYTVSPDLTEFGGEDAEDVETRIIQLDRLAVGQQHQRQGLGESLLVRLILQVLERAEEYNVEALSLFALDDEAKEWYISRNLGFEELEPGSNFLVLPVSTMRLHFAP